MAKKKKTITFNFPDDFQGGAFLPELARFYRLPAMLFQIMRNTELKKEFGASGYRNLAKPDVLTKVKGRASRVMRLACELKEAHQKRDIDKVGILALQLGEAWGRTVAAAYEPQVRTSDKKTEALDQSNMERTKRNGLADKVNAIQAQEGCGKTKAMRLVAKTENVALITVKRACKPKVHPLG